MNADPIYKIVDIEAADLDTYADGVDQMQNAQIDGFIVRNVLNREELDKLIAAHALIPEDKQYFSDTGMIIYPPPFSLIDQTSAGSIEKMEKFYADAELLWSAFPQDFGVDFEQKIHDIIGKISGGRTVETPVGLNNVGKYSPAGFKHLIPGEGHFKAHCGHMFHLEFPHFFRHIAEISVLNGQMSYFVMLDPPQSGGELTLYNVLWENVEIRTKDDEVLQDKKGKLIPLEDPKVVKKQPLKPGAGDMIIFTGGRIWHKVEVAQGTRRLTCGGFLTLSRDGKTIYTWT